MPLNNVNSYNIWHVTFVCFNIFTINHSICFNLLVNHIFRKHIFTYLIFYKNNNDDDDNNDL